MTDFNKKLFFVPKHIDHGLQQKIIFIPKHASDRPQGGGWPSISQNTLMMKPNKKIIFVPKHTGDGLQEE